MREPNTSNQRSLLLGVAIAAVVGLAIALAVVEQRTQRDVEESAGWVAHTLTVAREFQVTLTLLDEMETGLRGFLLTGRAAYLQPYEGWRTQVDVHLARLRALTADNPSQQARLAQLAQPVAGKLAVMARTVSEFRAQRHAEALRIVETDEGQRLMDAIRSIVKEGVEEEERLLTTREQKFEASVRVRSLMIEGLGIVVLLTVAIIVWLLRRLEQSLGLVHLCGWSRSVEYEGEWITFEGYLQRRFNLNVTLGISPAEAARFVEEHGDPRR